MVLKKLLSVSGLLVASVALANAATVIVDVNSTNFKTSGSTATYTVSGLTFTITASSGSLSFDTESSSATGNAAWYTTSKDTLFTGDREWAKNLTSTWIQNTNNNLTVTISGYEANQTGITLLFVAGRPFEAAGSWAKNANVSNGYTSGKQYTVPKTNETATVTEQEITSTTEEDTTPFSAQYYSFSGITADSSGTVTFTIKGVSNHSAGLSAIQCTIPEPSAFGLLAGLGAIALAVSRRRSRR